MQSASLTPEIRELFDQYRIAFDRLDGEALAHLYAAPSGILAGASYLHWPDFDSVRANMVGLCERYRSRGYLAAHYEPAWSVRLGAHAAIADIAWRIELSGDREPWRFHTSYNLVRTPAGWRVLLCTAYEEHALGGWGS